MPKHTITADMGHADTSYKMDIDCLFDTEFKFDVHCDGGPDGLVLCSVPACHIRSDEDDGVRRIHTVLRANSLKELQQWTELTLGAIVRRCLDIPLDQVALAEKLCFGVQRLNSWTDQLTETPKPQGDTISWYLGAGTQRSEIKLEYRKINN